MTGSAAANELAANADVILAVGTRLQDFTTASHTLFQNPQRRFVSINVCRHDVAKSDAVAIQGDAVRSIEEIDALLGEPRARADLAKRIKTLRASWHDAVEAATKDVGAALPSDAQVLGAVNRTIGSKGTVVCAAGGLPGELAQALASPGHRRISLEYGYSCMGYEIAGGLGVKLAHPQRDVVVMLGDGSYLMMNSEIATSVAMGLKLTIVLLDNRGFGLHQSPAGRVRWRVVQQSARRTRAGHRFAAHARSLGAHAQKVGNIRELEEALRASRTIERTVVLVIDTDPQQSTAAGGAWWDVAVPEVSSRANVTAAYETYSAKLADIKKDS